MTKPKMTDLIVVATAKSKPGKEAELLKALVDVAAPTRAQPGCVRFTLCRSKQDPSVVTALERWASAADLENHHKGAHVANLMAAMGPVVAEPPAMANYDVIDEAE